MNSSASKHKLFLPSLIGETSKSIDEIIKNIDIHYTERVEKKIDPVTKQPKTYLDGSIKERIIRPSRKRLKIIQSKIKDRILSKIALPTNVHGGVKKKSNVTNAKEHQGNKYIFATDLKDFFPSIKSKKIYDLFIELGYNRQFALYLTRLTTWKGELPQGTPTSTDLANIFFLKTDNELIDLCKKNGIIYTRYVDDLTFSSSKNFQDLIPNLLSLIKKSGLKISYRKTDYHNNQTITGIVVLLHKIDASKKLIEKSKLEVDNHPSYKPCTNYREYVLRTNRKVRN